jgi:hypothetical protein
LFPGTIQRCSSFFARSGIDGLRTLGWQVGRLGLFAGSLRLTGIKEEESVELFYQATPAGLSRGSTYASIQKRHALAPGALRPDLVLRRSSGDIQRWLVIEVKGGERRGSDSARAAAYDLLPYRTAFDPVLSKQTGSYGLGIAWGAELAPDLSSEVVLCTPDTLLSASW